MIDPSSALQRVPAVEAPLDQAVPAVRAFNRFYTRQIGVLDEGILRSELSLTEVRVLYELAHGQNLTAGAICKDLSLDAGYVSRMLREFTKRGLVRQEPSPADGREVLLGLTKPGRELFATLDRRQNQDVAAMLQPLSSGSKKRLIAAMQTISGLLGDQGRARQVSYVLRPHQPGDIGWIVHRHGVLYAREYGYDERFEALVAEIAAQFVQHLDVRRERCWIAEQESEIVGCVLLVKHSKTVAQLRLLLVEPAARGLGIGKRLVGECVRFARQVGYRKIMLWTQSELNAARHLYEAAGFRLREKHQHDSWGRSKLTAETWELKL